MARIDVDRIEEADRLLREREARSLTLLLVVWLIGWIAVSIQLAIQVPKPIEVTGRSAVALGYVGCGIAASIALLVASYRRRRMAVVGFLVALLSATFAATGGIVMWKGFVADAPVAVLTKLPIAAAGMAAIACMALTLRPLHVAIVGAGTALTLIGFFALSALDPSTVFMTGRVDSYLGAAVSPARLIVELVFVIGATAATAFAAHFARRTIREAIDFQRETDQLSRYFSPGIARGIRDGGGAFLRPGGREQDVVVLFSDLAGFTRLCAGLSASQALELLSEYHECMVAEIFKAKGTLDKFIGDGIMATFGTPNQVPDAADRAIRAARGMMAALVVLNESRTGRGLPPLAQRIGIHAGPAVVGNVGTAQRLEFTVIGDTVNVASRIQAACKKTGQAAMVSAAVVARLSNPGIVEPLGPIVLEGQPTPIDLYGLGTGSHS